MPSITFRALADFRDARAADFSKQVAIMMSVPNKESDAYYIAVDKALRAAEDCNAAHAELSKHSSIGTTPNPHCGGLEDDVLTGLIIDKMGIRACSMSAFNHVWDATFIEACRASLGTKAEEAYERAEATIEDAALSRFHHDAFGEGTSPN